MRWQRQRLAWLGSAAWEHVLSRRGGAEGNDPGALDCIDHWARHDLPLVITRQPPGWQGDHGDERLTLGLPAPECWGRRRLSLSVAATGVSRLGDFPAAATALPLMPPSTRANASLLCEALARLGVVARVYGSYGWQQLTGLACIHQRSDLDLLIELDTPARADAVVALLKRVEFDAPRIDGELVFADGSAVAWREWDRWRSGSVRQMLVKQLSGVALDEGERWKAAG